MSPSKTLCIILAILMLLASISMVVDSKNETCNSNIYFTKTPHYSHQPIHIHGNQEFTIENGVTSGSGTSEDPYLIERWDIISDGFSSAGVIIEETTVPFILCNCTISGFNQREFCAVNFIDVNSASIINVESFNNFNGIRIDQSSNIVVMNCINHDNFGKNDYYAGIDGFSAYSSNHISFITCESFRNRNNRFPYDLASGFGFYNSTFCLVENSISYDNQGCGIYLIHSTSDVVIRNCSLYNNWGCGVYANVERLRISNCTILQNGRIANNGAAGIYLTGDFNILENSVISGGYGNGVDTLHDENIIRNCTIDNHPHKAGISIAQSYGTLVEHCIISKCEVGISCYLSLRIQILWNVLESNTYGITTIFNQIGEFVTLRIHSNYIMNNSIFGLQLSPWTFADARKNWWGSLQGPTRGLIRHGDALSTQRFCLCLYRPWARSLIPDSGFSPNEYKN